MQLTRVTPKKTQFTLPKEAKPKKPKKEVKITMKQVVAEAFFGSKPTMMSRGTMIFPPPTPINPPMNPAEPPIAHPQVINFLRGAWVTSLMIPLPPKSILAEAKRRKATKNHFRRGIGTYWLVLAPRTLMIDPKTIIGTATLKTTNRFLIYATAAKAIANTFKRRAVDIASRSGIPNQSNIGIRTNAAPVPPMVRAVVAIKVIKKAMK